MDTAVPPEGAARIPTAGYQVGGRYTLRTAIGTGGMGTVWRGHDEVLRRPVAIKEVTLPRGIPGPERDLLCERTLREARAAAALNHPAVVRVYDVVSDDGRPWIVMELLEARSVADIVRTDGPLSPRTAASIGLAVLGALETAHAAGVLHRDVKPGNILVGADGRTTLTDFGVARSHGESPLTSTGLLLGSPQYIAPERARGQAFGPASDLWSLGATLYAAVEGRAPFDHGDPLPTLTAIVSDPPAPTSLAGPLAPVLDGLLTKDPAERSDHARARAGLTAVLRSTAPPKTTDPLPTLPIEPPAVPSHSRVHAGDTVTAPAPTSTTRPTRPTSPTRPARPAAAHQAHPHHPAPARPARTLPWRRAALAGAALVVAVLLGVGVYAVSGLRGQSGGAGTTVGAVVRYVAYTHPDGFTVELPEHWTTSGHSPVRAHSPSSRVWVQLYSQRVSSGDPTAVWQAADRVNGRNGPNPQYRLVDIRDSRAAGRPASDWEWTYQRAGETERRHVLGRGVVVDGRSYQLSISAPESQFAQYRAILDVIANSFRPSA